MDLNNEQIVEALGNKSVVEIIAITKALEQQWGVKAVPAPVQAQPYEGPVPNKVEEQTEFSVTLTGAGAKRIDVIKAVREITGLGLAEAKSFVETIPKLLKESVPKAEAEEIRTKIVAAGGTVDIK